MGVQGFIRGADVALRDVEAVNLRLQNMTFEQIADALGFKHRSSAKRAVDRVLDHAQYEAADALRTAEDAVLLAARERLVRILYTDHVHVSDGRVVRDETGNPILDNGPNIAAARELRQNIESRRKLYGLDAPARLEVSDALTAEIERLALDVAAAGGGAAAESTGGAAGPAGD